MKEPPKLLVVDDQPNNLKLLKFALEQAGMEVSVAASGAECLRLTRAYPPDLILLDVTMPEMDGIETCRELQKAEDTQLIPVIMVTAESSREGKLSGLEAGAVDYITKPIDLQETLARPHSKSLSSGRFQVFRHRRTSLWLAGVGFQAADAADEQVLSGHRRGLLHNTHICRCLEAYSSRGAFFSELQSGRIQAACSSSSRRRFFISMMRQQL